MTTRQHPALSDDQISSLNLEIRDCSELALAVYQASTKTKRGLWTKRSLGQLDWWRWWPNFIPALALVLALYGLVVEKWWFPHNTVSDATAVHETRAKPTAHQSIAHNAPVVNKVAPSHNTPAALEAPTAHATDVHRAAPAPVPTIRQNPAHYGLLNLTALYALYSVVILIALYVVVVIVLLAVEFRNMERRDPFTVAAIQSHIERRFVNGLAKYDDDVIRFTIAELKLSKSKLESWPSYVSDNFKMILPLLAAFGLGVVTSGRSLFAASQWGATLFGLLFIFVMYATRTSYNEIHTIARILALLEFYLADDKSDTP